MRKTNLALICSIMFLKDRMAWRGIDTTQSGYVLYIMPLEFRCCIIGVGNKMAFVLKVSVHVTTLLGAGCFSFFTLLA